MKIFGGDLCVRSKFSCVRSSNDLRARAYAHRLDWSRFLQRPQRRSRGNQLIQKLLTKNR